MGPTTNLALSLLRVLNLATLGSLGTKTRPDYRRRWSTCLHICQKEKHIIKESPRTRGETTCTGTMVIHMYAALHVARCYERPLINKTDMLEQLRRGSRDLASASDRRNFPHRSISDKGTSDCHFQMFQFHSMLQAAWEGIKHEMGTPYLFWQYQVPAATSPQQILSIHVGATTCSSVMRGSADSNFTRDNVDSFIAIRYTS